MNRIFSLILLVVFTPSSAFAGGPVLPDKYRLPSNTELEHQWSGETREALIQGDFNGDGLVDGASIVIDEEAGREVLLAFLVRDDEVEWLELGEMPFDGKVFMEIDNLAPGKYDVICEPDLPCEPDSRMQIAVVTDSLMYCRPGSACSIFVWDGEGSVFQKYWISD